MPSSFLRERPTTAPGVCVVLGRVPPHRGTARPLRQALMVVLASPKVVSRVSILAALDSTVVLSLCA